MARLAPRRLSPGEAGLLRHYRANPQGVKLHGPLEPLTQGVAHELAPTTIAAPAAPADTRIDRYGAVSGGNGLVPPSLQLAASPTRTAELAVDAPGPIPPDVAHVLSESGLLDAVGRLRAQRVGANEDLKQPADLTNAIVAAATLGTGPEIISGVKGAQVAADAALDAGGSAATDAGTSTAAKLAQSAGRAVTAPLRHPIVTSTSPVVAQVPAAVEQGNPNQLLYGLEGTGVLASALGGAGKGVKGAIPGIVGNAASDLINLPAQALPSIYLSGKALADAATGNSAPLSAQAKGFEQQSPLYALATGHLGQAAQDAYEHPIYSYLEGEGVKSALGNVLGRAGSAAGAFQRNEPRPGLGIYGERTAERAPYSNDVFRKALQQRSDAKREPFVGKGVMDFVDKAGEAAPRLQASGREITAYLNDFADRRAYENEGYRKGRRDKRQAELEAAKPDNKADQDVVGLQAQGIISHDPARARLDLAQYRNELVDAQHNGITGLDGEQKLLTKSQIKQNRDLVKKIDNAVQHATLDNRPTLEVMAKLDRELSGGIIKKGIGLPGGEEQAAIARAIPHAARFLESKYGLSRDTALQLAAEETKSNEEGRSIGQISRLRSHTQVLDKDGHPLSLEKIHESMVANGVDPDLVSYVSNRQPLEPGAEADASIHYQPPDERGQIRSRSRTGSAVAKGLVDPRFQAMVDAITGGGTKVDRAANFDQNANVIGIRKPDGKGFSSGDEAADAIAHPEDYGMKPLPEIPGGYVGFRLTPWPATSGQLDATESLGRNRMENEVGRTTEADPQEIEGLNYDPADGAEFSEKAHHDAIVNFGTRDASESGPVVIVPKTIANRLAEHYTKSTTFEKGLQKLTGTFKGAVLPTSVKWLAGNTIDNWLVRSLLTGTVTDIPSGVRFSRYVKKVLDEQGPEAAERAMESILPGTIYGSVKLTQPYRGADQFIGTKVGPLASALHKFFETPGPKQVVNAWHYYRDTVFHLDSKYIEQLPQYGALGKAARHEVDMTRRQFKAAIEAQTPVLRDLAEGFRNPDTVDRFAKSVERIFGNWGKNSPTARRFFTQYAPFWQWTRAAFKFVYLTLPRDHPALTGLLAASQTMTREERLKFGFDFDAKNPLPDWMQGDIPNPGKPGGLLSINGLTSFGFFGSPANAIASNALPPLIGPIALSGLGVDWKGEQLVKADGQPMNDVEKAKVAMTSTGESFIPFLTQLKEVLGGKSEHTYNPVRAYGKGSVEGAREPRESISVPVKEEEPGTTSSAGAATSGIEKFVEGVGGEASGVEKFVEGLE